MITGGAGFIGSNLCRRLSADPAFTEIVVLDDLSTGDLTNLDGIDVRFVRGSITDDRALDQATDGVDAVVHLAALGSVPRSVADPIATHHANATGTVMVLEAARRHGLVHTVVASSSSVYGSNPVLPKNEDLVARPMSPYAASKLLTEGATLAWGAAYGMDVLAFRFFNVFGPHQTAGHAYAAVIPVFVDAALAGRPVPVHGDGTQSRDFTFVDTVTDVIADALTRRVTSTAPVNLAFGSRITLLDLITEIEVLLGRPIEREHLPARAGDVPHSQADNARLRALFPTADPVPFDHALRTTMDWMAGAVPRTDSIR